MILDAYLNPGPPEYELGVATSRLQHSDFILSYFTPTQSITLRSVLVASSHLRPDIPSALFRLCLLINISYLFLIISMGATYSSDFNILDCINLMIYGERYKEFITLLRLTFICLLWL